MTTKQIIEILIGADYKLDKEVKDGKWCSVSLYRCNLQCNLVDVLFTLEIDHSLSVNNPRIYINIPDGDVEEIYQHECKYSPKNLEMFMTLIPTRLVEKFGKELSFVVFSILHEIGHWEYICNNMISPVEYEQQDCLEREIVKCKLEEANTEEGIEEVFWSYRDITSEKEADKFALQELEVCLEKIKEQV